MNEIHPSLHQSPEEDLARYRAVSPLALLAMVLGLFAWLAFLGALLWIVPLAGAACGLLALRAIATSDGALTGRKAAMAGLVLSLFFGGAVAGQVVSYDLWVARQARGPAEMWFDLLLHKEPHKAHQLESPARIRQALDASLWEYYRGNSEAREGLENFVNTPVVQTLLSLGATAKVRYWSTPDRQEVEGTDYITQIYAVTSEDQDGRPKTFFAVLRLERTTDASTGKALWRVIGYDALKSPPPGM